MHSIIIVSFLNNDYLHLHKYIKMNFKKNMEI